MKFNPLILLFCLLPLLGFSQDRISTEEYIETYKDVAIKKMKEYKIPASITLAQGILESGSGNSRLARIANNHFGIKCHKGWTGKTFTMDDDEKDECFRKYKNPADSYRDHSLFLTQRGRYSFLFEYEITDYKSWAKGLKKAGYATNPKYPQLLISIIERYELYQYDRGGKRKKKKKEKDVVVAETAALSFASLTKGKDPVDSSVDGRDVYENNGIPFILAEKGDTFYGLAEEFNIYTWQLFKYNEVDKKYVLKIGDVVYLEKKKKKASKENKTHQVAYGESWHFLSQYYGIRESRLKKLNGMKDQPNLPVGTQLKLR